MLYRNILLPLLLASICVPALAAKHALLIGVDDYRQTGLQSLDGASNDVRVVHESLLQPRFGFDEEDVTVLTNEQANHDALKEAFRQLGQRVTSNDSVYIHYSGHGSFTQDLNGDEPNGQDQTWVSYGARRPDSPVDDINGFDVLDDELGDWLAPLFDRVDQVVMVSDSCHSATVSRGSNAIKTRAAAFDKRMHPLGTGIFDKPDFDKGVQIGAARDREQAAEYRGPDGNTYGLFTWFWAQALNNAQPGDTWDDLFKQTSTQVRLQAGNGQTPQLTGTGNREVFDGRFQPPRKTVPVIAVNEQDQTSRLQTGRLTGATVGSIYTVAGQESTAAASATIELTRVDAYQSQGRIDGSVRVGDLVEETHHSYPFEPSRVFLNADFPNGQDADLLVDLKTLLEQTPGFEQTASQSEADLVFYVLRPDRGQGLDGLRETGPDGTASTLPPSFPDQAPEVWILTPSEQLYHPRLRFSLAEDQKTAGLTELQRDLGRLLRVREIKRLSSRATPGVEVAVTRYRPDNTCSTAPPECLALDVGSYRRLDLSLTALSALSAQQASVGELLVFSLSNPGRDSQYVYLLNITADGEIEAIFPQPGDPMQTAEVPAGTLDFMPDSGLELDIAGEETIKVIISRQPLDVALLESAAYSGHLTRGESPLPVLDAKLDPLNRLLAQAASNTRGRLSLRMDNWATNQATLQVEGTTGPNTGAESGARGGAGSRGLGYLANTGRFVKVKVHFGTNRAQEGLNANGVPQFGNKRGDLVFGNLWVSIPPNHRPGELEAPSVLRLELSEDPERHVILTELETLDTDRFKESLAQTLANTPGRSLMVYVHGFNNGFEEAARRTAQIAFDMNAEGVDLVPAVFSWPSGQSVSPLQYTYAWTNKDWAKGDLAEFLLTVSEGADADNIFLVGHSMGTNLLSNAMERIQMLRCQDKEPLFQEIILAAPDIDAGTFRKELAPALAQLAKRTTIYTAKQDLALQISQTVHGGFPRLGDSSGQIYVVPEMETVDVSEINISDIGHGYYAQIRDVIRDIGGIFNGHSTADRGLLSDSDSAARVFWRFPER